jgi:hypothetical protein
MKIHWGRIVIAGFVAEFLLLAVYRVVSQTFASFVGGTIILGGGFVFMFVGALWVGRKIESRFILHGLLVGVFAVVFYIIATLPTVLRGQYASNYWVDAIFGHTPKLLGGIVGGFIAGRKAKAR